MSDRSETSSTVVPLRRLSDAIREVKNAAADREDVVVELREATRIRLQLLAAELAPVFADIPSDNDAFDFAISSGLQPRLWIDAVAHVAMGRDRRSFRFVRDTRIGRVVIAETPDMAKMADHVTRYVAERIVERERMMEGPVAPGVEGALAPQVREVPRTIKLADWREVISGFWIVAAGALIGLLTMVALLWDRLFGLRG